eukprot:9200616-Pyramimonas_sp.AAC.1
MGMLSGRTSETWTKHHQACARNSFALGAWPQARLKEHGLATEDCCQLCREQPGTLMRAAMLMEEKGECLEKFAAGVFPHPEEVIPPPLKHVECSAFWSNTPPSGKLQGVFFPGRFCFEPHLRLHEEGWVEFGP